MGKNQTHKAMQRAKAMSRGPSTGAGEEMESSDGMVDGTFHSPEWHAARLKALQTTHTVTWEEWKAQRKEELRKQEEAEGLEEKRMREYRDQLDREREERLAKGRNHADKKEKLKKKDKKEKRKDKDKDRKKKTKKSRKRKSSGSESLESSDSDSASEKDKKPKKQKKEKESDGDLSSASDEGPVRLSSFLMGGAGGLSSDSERDDKRERKKSREVEKDPVSASLREAMEEARRRAEIGAHMVKEVRRAEQVGDKRKW